MERFLHDQPSKPDVPPQSFLTWTHADPNAFGITPSSAQGKKPSWPRRNATGNHFTIEISDWQPSRLCNVLVKCSPDSLLNVVTDCFYLQLFLSSKGTEEKLKTLSVQCIVTESSTTGSSLPAVSKAGMALVLLLPSITYLCFSMSIMLISISWNSNKPGLSWILLKTFFLSDYFSSCETGKSVLLFFTDSNTQISVNYKV